jgi:DNA-binding XRE family transcriptional regulator
MRDRKPFEGLRARVDANPERRARVDEIKHAMRDALALAQLREGRALTQEVLAEAMGVTQANISRIEHQRDLYLSTLGNYISALGGRLEIRAVFVDQTIEIGVDSVALSSLESSNREQHRLERSRSGSEPGDRTERGRRGQRIRLVA